LNHTYLRQLVGIDEMTVNVYLEQWVPGDSKRLKDHLKLERLFINACSFDGGEKLIADDVTHCNISAVACAEFITEVSEFFTLNNGD